MAKDWRVYALYILDSTEKIRLILNRGSIAEDFILYDAALRNLQTLSESISHLPEELKLQYANINWKNITGFRNILVHNYLGDIDPQTVQKVISDYLPELEKVIKSMLNN